MDTPNASGNNKQKVRNLDLLDPFGYPVYEDTGNAEKGKDQKDQQPSQNSMTDKGQNR